MADKFSTSLQDEAEEKRHTTRDSSSESEFESLLAADACDRVRSVLTRIVREHGKASLTADALNLLECLDVVYKSLSSSMKRLFCLMVEQTIAVSTMQSERAVADMHAFVRAVIDELGLHPAKARDYVADLYAQGMNTSFAAALYYFTRLYGPSFTPRVARILKAHVAIIAAPASDSITPLVLVISNQPAHPQDTATVRAPQNTFTVIGPEGVMARSLNAATRKALKHGRSDGKAATLLSEDTLQRLVTVISDLAKYGKPEAYARVLAKREIDAYKILMKNNKKALSALSTASTHTASRYPFIRGAQNRAAPMRTPTDVRSSVTGHTKPAHIATIGSGRRIQMPRRLSSEELRMALITRTRGNLTELVADLRHQLMGLRVLRPAVKTSSGRAMLPVPTGRN